MPNVTTSSSHVGYTPLEHVSVQRQVILLDAVSTAEVLLPFYAHILCVFIVPQIRVVIPKDASPAQLLPEGT